MSLKTLRNYCVFHTALVSLQNSFSDEWSLLGKISLFIDNQSKQTIITDIAANSVNREQNNYSYSKARADQFSNISHITITIVRNGVKLTIRSAG